ncbi:SPOR domain-containing protein [Neobacillus muris]|uniref:SPOR domain-containing protein n=1 Tax=Neobacillus muris TaxID=2941334 RepID=UPI00203E4EED|nr:SPOR domain-containing protein [Neobacillus muris]
MDKPRKKDHTITVKINGEQTPYQEEPKKKGPEPQKPPQLKVIKTNHSEPDLEEDVFLETAAAQESVEESFDWIIPESSDQEIEEIPMKTSHKITHPFSPKKTRRPIGSIVTAGIFAILIGTTIGVFMLKLVIVESDEKTGADTNTVAQEETNAGTAETTGQASGVVKEFTTYLVQGGYFSSTDGAKETETQLKSKGIPAQIIEMEGKHYIFLGAADSLETAKTLSSQYKESGVNDAFAKSIVVGEKKISDLTDGDKTFLESVPVIYQSLAQAMTDGSAKTLEGAGQPLKTNGLKNENVKKIKVELSNAYDNIQSYQKSKDKKTLTEAQQSLLTFLSLYYSM